MLSGVPGPHFDSTLRRMRILRSDFTVVGKGSTLAHASRHSDPENFLHFRRRDFLQKRSDTTTARKHISSAVDLLARPQKKLFLSTLGFSMDCLLFPRSYSWFLFLPLFASAQRKRERGKGGKQNPSHLHFLPSILEGSHAFPNIAFWRNGFSSSSLFLLFDINLLLVSSSLFWEGKWGLMSRDNISCF